MYVHAFWRTWHGTGNSEDFVRYPLMALEAFALLAADQVFLTEAGFPAWSAPHLHFFAPDGTALPPPEDPYGAPHPHASPGWGMIGSADDGWPLCFDRTRPGVVLWLPADGAPAGVVVNSSVRQLAATLLAYNQTIEMALARGSARGEEDVWRRRLYPRELDDQLVAKLREIDPVTMQPGNFWARHFHDRNVAT